MAAAEAKSTEPVIGNDRYPSPRQARANDSVLNAAQRFITRAILVPRRGQPDAVTYLLARRLLAASVATETATD